MGAVWREDVERFGTVLDYAAATTVVLLDGGQTGENLRLTWLRRSGVVKSDQTIHGDLTDEALCVCTYMCVSHPTTYDDFCTTCRKAKPQSTDCQQEDPPSKLTFRENTSYRSIQHPHLSSASTYRSILVSSSDAPNPTST